MKEGKKTRPHTKQTVRIELKTKSQLAQSDKDPSQRSRTDERESSGQKLSIFTTYMTSTQFYIRTVHELGITLALTKETKYSSHLNIKLPSPSCAYASSFSSNIICKAPFSSLSLKTRCKLHLVLVMNSHSFHTLPSQKAREQHKDKDKHKHKHKQSKL